MKNDVTFLPPVHCCVCVNLAIPPWPRAIASVDGYAGCAEHVQLLATHPQLGWACKRVTA